MWHGKTTTTVSAPSAAPVDLNEAGRPTFRELAPLFGLTILTLLPVALGGAILLWAWPESEYQLSGWNMLGMLVGGMLALGGIRYFWPLSATIPAAVNSYYARINDWHNAVLDKYQEGDGQIVAQSASEWHYSMNDMRHVALAFFALYLSGAQSMSIEQLQKNGLWVTAGNATFPLIRFSQDGAAEFLALLSQAGVIDGRRPKAAGRIAIMDVKTAATKVLRLAAQNPALIAAARAAMEAE